MANIKIWKSHLNIREGSDYHSVYHEYGILVLGTDRSQKEPYQENIVDEEGFQINFQSQQSW